MIAKTKKPTTSRDPNYAKRFALAQIDNRETSANKPHSKTEKKRAPSPPRLGPRPFDGTLDF